MATPTEGSAPTAAEVAETESLIGISDLIKRNILPDDIENTLASTSKSAVRNDKPELVILRNKEELQNILEALRSGNINHKHTGTLQYARNNRPDIGLIRSFMSSVLVDYAPDTISFSENADGGYLLDYPMRHVLSTAHGSYLDEDDSHSVPDGQGYPAFFPMDDASLKYSTMTGRVSMTHYPSNVSSMVLGKINSLYDPSTARAFQNSFQLRSEEDC